MNVITGGKLNFIFYILSSFINKETPMKGASHPSNLKKGQLLERSQISSSGKATSKTLILCKG